MTAFLPPNLLALFAPRDPIPYLPPSKLPIEKKRVPYTGVAAFLKNFEDSTETPPPTRVETKDEKKERKQRERAEQVAYKLEQDLAMWDPHNDPIATEDGFKTLFVARVNFDTSESKLRREFETYGPVKKIRMVSDQNTGKPRGYAFIEFEHERDMHSAYKHADGKKIDGRRVLVDVERARTVKGWRPRRLGGGLGQTRKGGVEENSRFAGRDDGRRAESRDRDRSPADRRRHKSRSRERRRSRSRERRRRSRSRERKRSRDRGDRGDRAERSRSRERKRRRSRSRDRDRERRKRRSRSKERVTIKRERDRDDDQQLPPQGDYDDEGDFMNRPIKAEPEMKGHYGGSYQANNGDGGDSNDYGPPEGQYTNDYGGEQQ